MTNIDIQTKGMNQTISSVNGKQHVDQIKWDAGFDGKNADVSLDLMKDGKMEHFNVQVNKDALAQMLNVKTVNKPIEKRLLSTFSTFGKSGAKTTFKKSGAKTRAKSRVKRIPLEQMIIEFDDPLLKNPPLEKVEPNIQEIEVPNQLSELLEQLTHISSPFANEKVVVPLQKSNFKKSTFKKSTFKKSRAKSKKMRYTDQREK
jgi:hypothetical protein